MSCIAPAEIPGLSDPSLDPAIFGSTTLPEMPRRPAPAGFLSGYRIVVVDDDPHCADVQATVLQAFGARVRRAYSGLSALGALEDGFRPHIFLIDVFMPDMDGCELARRIRERADCRDARFIALSGWGDAADRARTRQAGFLHHLVKPLELSELIAALDPPQKS